MTNSDHYVTLHHINSTLRAIYRTAYNSPLRYMKQICQIDTTFFRKELQMCTLKQQPSVGSTGQCEVQSHCIPSRNVAEADKWLCGGVICESTTPVHQSSQQVQSSDFRRLLQVPISGNVYLCVCPL